METILPVHSRTQARTDPGNRHRSEVFASSVPAPRGRPGLKAFLRFGGLSGFGWLVDFGLLLLLVRLFGLRVLVANLISATTAATLVFLLSRRFVFAGKSDAVLIRLLIYAAYTFLVILVASTAMNYVAETLVISSQHLSVHLTATMAAAIAKVIVTPLNFFLNFFVAKITSEHDAAA